MRTVLKKPGPEVRDVPFRFRPPRLVTKGGTVTCASLPASPAARPRRPLAAVKPQRDLADAPPQPAAPLHAAAASLNVLALPLPLFLGGLPHQMIVHENYYIPFFL